MARNPDFYTNIVYQLVDLLGVGRPNTTTIGQVAQALGVSTSAIDRVKQIMHAIGALEQTYKLAGWNTRGNKQIPVKASVWTITMDADAIMAKAKAEGWKWQKPDTKRMRAIRGGNLLWGSKAKRGRSEPKVLTEDSGIVHWSEPKATTPAEQTVASVGEEMSDNPFAALKSLKRNDAMALIESARQYQNRMEFITEEVERFAQHGLTLDPASIGFPRDERMETIGLVVDYVSRIERENERLQAYAQQGSNERELRDQIRRQEEQLSRMVRERAEQMELVNRLQNQMSGREATYRQQIARLEQDLFDARRQNGVARGDVSV